MRGNSGYGLFGLPDVAGVVESLSDMVTLLRTGHCVHGRTAANGSATLLSVVVVEAVVKENREG